MGINCRSQVILIFSQTMSGYSDLSCTGSIIANPGFVDVMKSVENDAGVMVIDPQHVSAWGGIGVAGNIVGAAYGPLSV